eukprot:scaffold12691_cov108-Isochrysis_galbana.AAC.7
MTPRSGAIIAAGRSSARSDSGSGDLPPAGATRPAGLIVKAGTLPSGCNACWLPSRVKVVPLPRTASSTALSCDETTESASGDRRSKPSKQPHTPDEPSPQRMSPMHRASIIGPQQMASAGLPRACASSRTVSFLPVPAGPVGARPSPSRAAAAHVRKTRSELEGVPEADLNDAAIDGGGSGTGPAVGRPPHGPQLRQPAKGVGSLRAVVEHRQVGVASVRVGHDYAHQLPAGQARQVARQQLGQRRQSLHLRLSRVHHRLARARRHRLERAPGVACPVHPAAEQDELRRVVEQPLGRPAGFGLGRHRANQLGKVGFGRTRQAEGSVAAEGYLFALGRHQRGHRVTRIAREPHLGDALAQRAHVPRHQPGRARVRDYVEQHGCGHQVEAREGAPFGLDEIGERSLAALQALADYPEPAAQAGQRARAHRVARSVHLGRGRPEEFVRHCKRVGGLGQLGLYLGRLDEQRLQVGPPALHLGQQGHHLGHVGERRRPARHVGAERVDIFGPDHPLHHQKVVLERLGVLLAEA